MKSYSTSSPTPGISGALWPASIIEALMERPVEAVGALYQAKI